MQYTNEGDPAQEVTKQEQNEHDAQIRAMQQKASVQYTNEGDPAQEVTKQEQNEHDAQIRAMQQKASVQYTNQGEPAQEDTAQNRQNAQIKTMQHRTQTDKAWLQGKGKVTIRDSGNDFTGTPPMVEEATTASRLKLLKKDGQMESQTRLYPSDHRSSARTNSTETEVIPGMPDEIFTKVQQVHKDPGVTTSSSELKPKRTCRQRRAGHMKEKLNNSDWSQERTL